MSALAPSPEKRTRAALAVFLTLYGYIFLYAMATLQLASVNLSGRAVIPEIGDLVQYLISAFIGTLLFIIPFLALCWLMERVVMALRVNCNSLYLSVLLIPFLMLILSLVPRSDNFSAMYRGCVTFIDGSRTDCGVTVLVTNFIVGLTVSFFTVFALDGLRRSRRK
jgi:hypothetical protein